MGSARWFSGTAKHYSKKLKTTLLKKKTPCKNFQATFLPINLITRTICNETLQATCHIREIAPLSWSLRMMENVQQQEGSICYRRLKTLLRVFRIHAMNEEIRNPLSGGKRSAKMIFWHYRITKLGVCTKKKKTNIQYLHCLTSPLGSTEYFIGLIIVIGSSIPLKTGRIPISVPFSKTLQLNLMRLCLHTTPFKWLSRSHSCLRDYVKENWHLSLRV